MILNQGVLVFAQFLNIPLLSEPCHGPVITRRELFEEISSTAYAKDSLRNYIIKKFVLENCPEDVGKCIECVLKTFMSEYNKRWKQCHRIKERFLEKHSNWLNKSMNFPDTVYKYIVSLKHMEDELRPSTSKVGRPQKCFAESGERTKRTKLQPLMETYSGDEIVFAAQCTLQSSGKRDAAGIVKEVTQTTPTRATKIKKAYKSPVVLPKPYTGEEALALLVENKFTKQQYINIRKGSKDRNSDIYPSYHIIRGKKIECYPPKDDFTITETLAEIKLQSLLDHTVRRLIQSLENEVIQTLTENESMQLIWKWGCDGSSGQGMYHQQFEREDAQDSSIFIVCAMPLQLTIKESETVLWKNTQSSSTKLCRPIKITFQKETADLIKKEVDNIETQIGNLIPTKVTVDNKEFSVSSILLLTMVDGKVCSTIKGISSQKCFVCGATPTEMNNLQLVKTKQSDPSSYRFGLSILHTWIRFFECLLHIAYRLDIKKWQVRKDEKESFAARKASIVKRFRQEMGLIVDQPKPGGSGTTNTGNTARRFFQKPELSSAITGINFALIKQFGTILTAISSGFHINTEAFDKFCLGTATLFIELYPWFYMPPSVHKILIHGSSIIENAILPIGQLSEEAQESRNKDFRHYREHHARKCSRTSNIEDVMNMLLLSSDPVISKLRITPICKKQKMPIEVLSLLKDVPSDSDSVESFVQDSNSDSSDDASV